MSRSATATGLTVLVLSAATVNTNAADLPALPVPVYDAAAVTFGDQLYVFGGFTTTTHEVGSGSFRLNVDPTFGNMPSIYTWFSLPDLPAPRATAVAVALQQDSVTPGNVYLIGGCNKTLATQSNVFVLATATWTWSDDVPSDMSTPRDRFGGGALDFNSAPKGSPLYGVGVVVVGGTDQTGLALASAEALVVETGKWHALPDLPSGPRRSHAVAVSDNRLFVVGGVDGTGSTLKHVVEMCVRGVIN
jgi:N-acetylneuraminic acid mutarotase